MVGMIGTWNYPAVPQRPANRPGPWPRATPSSGSRRSSPSGPDRSSSRASRKPGCRRAWWRPSSAAPRSGRRSGRCRSRQGDVHRRRRERPAGAGGAWGPGASPRWRSFRASTRRSSCPTRRWQRTVRALTLGGVRRLRADLRGGQAGLRRRRRRALGRGLRGRRPASSEGRRSRPMARPTSGR